MGGSVIGKSLNYGWFGKSTRSADSVIESRIVDKASDDIAFGAPVFLTATNTYENYADGKTADKFVGIAVASVRQSTEYGANGNSARYQPNLQADVLIRGSAIVKLAVGSSNPVAGGKVYLVKTTGEYTATSTDNIELTNARFATGKVDANRAVEVTLLTRNVL